MPKFQLNAVSNLTKLKHFRKGEKMMTEGEPATEMYVILNGNAEIFINGAHVNFVRERNIIGEAIMEVTVAPRTASVVATTNSSVIVLTREDYRDTMLQYKILE